MNNFLFMIGFLMGLSYQRGKKNPTVQFVERIDGEGNKTNIIMLLLK